MQLIFRHLSCKTHASCLLKSARHEHSVPTVITDMDGNTTSHTGMNIFNVYLLLAGRVWRSLWAFDQKLSNKLVFIACKWGGGWWGMVCKTVCDVLKVNANRRVRRWWLLLCRNISTLEHVSFSLFIIVHPFVFYFSRLTSFLHFCSSHSCSSSHVKSQFLFSSWVTLEQNFFCLFFCLCTF